jgi:hypothetical protein
LLFPGRPLEVAVLLQLVPQMKMEGENGSALCSG